MQDVSRWNRDTKSARDVRNKEKLDFQATNTDYGDSIDALALAITTLKKQDFYVANHRGGNLAFLSTDFP